MIITYIYIQLIAKLHYSTLSQRTRFLQVYGPVEIYVVAICAG